MELIEVLSIINLIVISPIWFTIKSLKEDIRELRTSEKQILLTILEQNQKNKI